MPIARLLIASTAFVVRDRGLRTRRPCVTPFVPLLNPSGVDG
jgi:hypothetical protein